jgi:hypothetical protein
MSPVSPNPADKIFKTLKWMHGHFWKWRGGLVSKKNLGGFSKAREDEAGSGSRRPALLGGAPAQLAPNQPISMPDLALVVWVLYWKFGCQFP